MCNWKSGTYFHIIEINTLRIDAITPSKVLGTTEKELKPRRSTHNASRLPYRKDKFCKPKSNKHYLSQIYISFGRSERGKRSVIYASTTNTYDAVGLRLSWLRSLVHVRSTKGHRKQLHSNFVPTVSSITNVSFFTKSGQSTSVCKNRMRKNARKPQDIQNGWCGPRSVTVRTEVHAAQ